MMSEGRAALWPLGRINVKAACGQRLGRPNSRRMSKGDEERAKRLAEALRQNLRRRKAQARGEEEKRPQSRDEQSSPTEDD